MKQEEEKDRSAMRERNQSAKVNVPHGSKDTGQDLKKERKTKELVKKGPYDEGEKETSPEERERSTNRKRDPGFIHRADR
jgi:hypothetical protein